MKRLFIIFLLLPSLCLGAGINDRNFGNVVVTEVTSIYDADTFRANIDTWPDIVGSRVPVRVKGVDAPEIRGKCELEKIAAQEAKQYTVSKLRAAKTIELKNISRGKYFRLLADVYVDGKSLGQELINNGHARAYGGGTRESWCKQGL